MLTQILRRERIIRQENTRYAISINPQNPGRQRVVMVQIRVNEAYGQKPWREAICGGTLDKVERAALQHRVEALAGGKCLLRCMNEKEQKV